MKEGERLVGVLTIYACENQPFGDDHKYLAERVAELLTARFVTLAEQPVRSFRRIERTAVVAER
jgi:hypothetical protein